MTYAEKVWEEANKAYDCAPDLIKPDDAAISIISAALKRQRWACLRAYQESSPELHIIYDAILNAEVKVKE